MGIYGLHISGFRGLSDLQLPNLAPVTVFVGANNTGKTSVLEAIGMSFGVTRPGLLGIGGVRGPPMRPWRDASDVDMAGALFHGLDTVQPLFSSGEDEARARFFIQTDGVDQEIRVDAHLFTLRLEEEEIDRRMPARIRHNLRDDNGMITSRFLAVETRSVDGLGRFLFSDIGGRTAPESAFSAVGWDPEEVEASLRSPGRIRRGIGRVGAETIPPVARSAVREMLGSSAGPIEFLSLLDSRFKRLEVIPVGQALQTFCNLNGRLVPLDSMGMGFRRAVAIAGQLWKSRGGVLLVDEVELGIHTWGIDRFIRWLVESAHELGVQLVLTTHSLETIDALVNSGQLDSLLGVRLQVSEGEIEPVRYEGELLHRVRREYGEEVRM